LRIAVADLIHHTQRQSVYIGGILYLDDLCLISINAQELDEMIRVKTPFIFFTGTPQSEKARMQINTDKSKIMAFHETAQQKNTRQKPMKKGGQKIYPAPFHLQPPEPPEPPEPPAALPQD